MATGFVQIRWDFFGVWGGSDSSPPDLLANGEGARCAAPPQKPNPRIGFLGHVTGVPQLWNPGYATEGFHWNLVPIFVTRVGIADKVFKVRGQSSRSGSDVHGNLWTRLPVNPRGLCTKTFAKYLLWLVQKSRLHKRSPAEAYRSMVFRRRLFCIVTFGIFIFTDLSSVKLVTYYVKFFNQFSANPESGLERGEGSIFPNPTGTWYLVFPGDTYYASSTLSSIQSFRQRCC